MTPLIMMSSTTLGFDKTNLSAWYDLEADGTDAHGSNNLTENNAPTYVSGKVGNAVDLEVTSSQSLSVVDNASLSIGANVDVTVGAWLKAESDVQMEIISKLSALAGNYEYDLYRNSGGTATWRVSSNGTALTTVTSSDTLDVATFGFVVAWYDQAKLYIQIDNGTPAEQAYSSDIFDGAAAFRIGANGAGLYGDGLIDSAFLFKRVLTAAERTTLYNGGSGVNYAAL